MEGRRIFAGLYVWGISRRSSSSHIHKNIADGTGEPAEHHPSLFVVDRAMQTCEERPDVQSLYDECGHRGTDRRNRLRQRTGNHEPGSAIGWFRHAAKRTIDALRYSDESREWYGTRQEVDAVRRKGGSEKSAHPGHEVRHQGREVGPGEHQGRKV